MGSVLVVDIGNTNLTFGLFRGERVARRSRLATAPLPSVAMLRAALKPYAHAESVVFASVVPKCDARIRKAVISVFGFRPKQLTPGSALGIKLRVDVPATVGADRIANALAAYRKSQGPAVVIDFGTATTFDCVARNGDYLGGAILPGPKVASEALALKAAKLPEVPIRPTRRVIGKNTVECLQAGIYYGYLGMIDRVLVETLHEFGSKNKPKIIVTGGLGRLFLKAMKLKAVYLPDLTLEGIRLFAAPKL